MTYHVPGVNTKGTATEKTRVPGWVLYDINVLIALLKIWGNSTKYT